MNDASADSNPDQIELDEVYLAELEDRWLRLLDDASEAAEPATASACIKARARLVEWLVTAPNPVEARATLAEGILDFAESLTADETFLAELLLLEARLLCRAVGSVSFAALVFELAERFYQTLPRATISALDELAAQLDDDPILGEAALGGGPSVEIAMLIGQAWLELDDGLQARDAFLRAYATADAETRPGLEYLIGGCTAEVGDIFEAADWAVRAIESAESIGQEVDPDFIANAAEILLRLLGERLTSGRPMSSYDRYRALYLDRPDWFLPLTGRPLYLTAAAEIVSDRGEFAEAWKLLDEAENAWSTNDALPEDWSREDARAEIALTRCGIAFSRGQVDLTISTVRESVAIVAPGTEDQRARLSALVSALLSTLGQHDAARTWLAQLVQPGSQAWGDVDQRRTDERVGFAVRLSAEILELTSLTLTSLNDPSAVAEIGRRWMRVADTMVDMGASADAELPLLMAATSARASGQPDVAQALVVRAKPLRAAPGEGTAMMSGAAEFLAIVEHLAVDDISALVPALADAGKALGSGNDYLAATIATMQTLAVKGAGASSRVVLRNACRAIQAHARWRAALPSSQERLAFDARLSAVLPLAYDAVAEVGEPRLVSEFIEFIRSQAMPEAQPSVSAATVSMQRLLPQLDGPSGATTRPDLMPLDDEILLTQPGRVRMPWGTTALAEFLEPTSESVVDLEISC